MKFTVRTDEVEWSKLIDARVQPFLKAATDALRETASSAVREGRSNIAGSGHFGPNWQQGLQFKMQNENSSEVLANIFHRSGLAPIFESGITIAGHRLLWIPTRPHMPAPRRSGLNLAYAVVRGVPLLFNRADRDPHRRPLYIGVPSVTIRKKWRIAEIVREQVDQFATVFRRYFTGD